MQKTQVIIIGAGPTGLSLAIQLLRYNIDFIILEKNSQTTPLSKAVVVQARTLEIFDEIGLAEPALQKGRVTTAMNMFYKGKRKAHIDLAGLGNGLSKFTFALSLEQSKTEKLLADHIIAKGKTIQWNSEFSKVEQTDSGVKAFYKDADGFEQTIEGEYAVGCDGGHSLIRHAIGESFEGDTVTKLFYVTDIILTSSVINKDELFIFLIKKGFVLFFPMEGTGHYRIIGILPGQENTTQTITFDSIKDEIKKELAVPISFDEVKWFSTYKVHSRKAGSFMKGRCFIAGDAGHIHTPAGGQGMNTGIQDTYNLAWKLAYTINHKLNAAVLNSYNQERTENAAHLLKTTDRMFEAMTGSTTFFNFMRLRVVPLLVNFISGNKRINKRIFPLISMTSIAYPNSELTIKSEVGKIQAGQRMPYFVFANGKNIFDFLSNPSFKLLCFGTEKNDTAVEQIKNKLIPVDFIYFKEVPPHIFNTNDSFYVLLRPDNHISYIGKNINSCTEFFEKILAAD